MINLAEQKILELKKRSILIQERLENSKRLLNELEQSESFKDIFSVFNTIYINKISGEYTNSAQYSFLKHHIKKIEESINEDFGDGKILERSLFLIDKVVSLFENRNDLTLTDIVSETHLCNHRLVTQKDDVEFVFELCVDPRINDYFKIYVYMHNQPIREEDKYTRCKFLKKEEMIKLFPELIYVIDYIDCYSDVEL